MNKLKPCPFCNGNAEYYVDDYYQDKHVVHCKKCVIEIRSEYSREQVMELWNDRYVPKGYKLVPIDATLEMAIAGTKEFVTAQKAGLGLPLASDVYAAMVDVYKDNE